MSTYTRADLKARINAGIKGKKDMMVDIDETINFLVRDILSRTDMRSTKRRTVISPGLFASTYEYAAPVDLKGMKVCSIKEQSAENPISPYSLVSNEDFATMRSVGTIAIDEHDNIKKLLIRGTPDGVTSVVSTLDTITAGGGTWVAFGDADSVQTDNGDFVRGAGSVAFNLTSAPGLTAGIQNVGLDSFDYSSFEGSNDSIFVFVKISDKDDINSFSIRYGDDASNYNEITVTQTAFNTAFAVGWNLLRFDVSNRTLTGSVTNTAGAYVAVFMNKNATKVSQTGFKVDQIAFRNGTPQFLEYYSKYGWKDKDTGAWKENSEDDGDYLNADTDEYNLYVLKGIELAGDEVDEAQASVNAGARFSANLRQYVTDNPSDAMLMTSDYQAQYYV